MVTLIVAALAGCADPNSSLQIRADVARLTGQIVGIDGVLAAEISDVTLHATLRLDRNLSRDEQVATMLAVREVLVADDRWGDEYVEGAVTEFFTDDATENPRGVHVLWRGLPDSDELREDAAVFYAVVDAAPVVYLYLTFREERSGLDVMPLVEPDGHVASEEALIEAYTSIWSSTGLDDLDVRVFE